MTQAQRETMIRFHKRMAEAYAQEGQHRKAATALKHVAELQKEGAR